MIDPAYDYLHNSPGPDELRLGLAVEAAGHFRTHSHAIHERKRRDHLLLYCVDGEGYLRMGRTQTLITAGHVFLAPAGKRHSYGCDPRTGWDIWYVHFHGDTADRIAAILGLKPPAPVAHVGAGKLDARFAVIIDLLAAKPIHFGLDVSAALLALLVTLKKCIDQHNLDHEGLTRAIDAPAANLDEMAQVASLSKFHFIRSFRRATGTTPWRHVINRRMMEAKQLLSDPDYSIQQIAFHLGYNDPNYFSRAFKKEVGISPRAFRKLHATGRSRAAELGVKQKKGR
ncbi:MAG: helix-turn-helix domain-containing protein [Candidatus Hydrogenedentes bacterium]|nr:helix-turn-helix domain-containing protein [Candidatus Hydrogenedentota bacterium]